MEELNKKLSDYNHRFYDLTEVLRLHFEAGKTYEKLSALVGSGRPMMESIAGTSGSGGRSVCRQRDEWM